MSLRDEHKIGPYLGQDPKIVGRWRCSCGVIFPRIDSWKSLQEYRRRHIFNVARRERKANAQP